MSWDASCFVRGLALTLMVSLLPATSRADDWPQWGGPRHDLVWRESGVMQNLPDKLPRVWSTPIAEGYAGPAVADGKVFMTDRVHGQGHFGNERVLALHEETGEVLWTHTYACTYDISYPAGPRATPVYDHGKLYTIGAVGHLFCFNASTGEILWSKNFVDDFGVKLATWGSAASPLVVGNQLIVLVGGPQALLVSFNKDTGAENWRSLDDPDIGYAPPVLFDFGGVEQLIQYHPHGISSVNPQTGTQNWSIPLQIRSGLTIATPRQVGNRLFITAFYNGSRMLEVSPDARGARILWQGQSDSEIKTDGLHGLMCTPWFDGDYIYGVCSYGQLRCIRAQTGERVWETFDATGEGRWWNAFLVRYEPIPNRFFIHNEQGDLITADLTPEGYKEISRSKLIEPTRPVQRRTTIWSHPAFANRSVFARNDKEIIRVDLTTGSRQ